MAVDAHAPAQLEAPGVPRALARVAAVPAQLWLGGMILVSFALRSIGALGHVVPYYFPDEYIYPALARSLAQHGKPVIRDGPAHFPALLEPLLAAPAWLQGDVVVAYQLTQAMHALVISLAAIPVYLLARRLGCGKGLGLGLAALSLSFPDLAYAGSMLSDPVGYPLALAAVYAAVRALEAPTRRWQLAFVGFSGLATFARVQYVVLPAVLVAGALIVERGSVRRAFRGVRVALAVFLTPVVLLLAVAGPAKVLGPYAHAQHTFHATAILHWTAADLMLLAYAVGWVIVPGALVGFAVALVRPRSRVEGAFAAVTTSFAALLLLESAFIADTSSQRFQERYLFALLPLVVLAFAVYVRRGLPHRRALALLALALLVVSARIPLAGYASSHGGDDSPTLHAVAWTMHLFGLANGALLVAIFAGILSFVAIGVALAPRRGPLVALVLTLGLGAALSAGATVWDANSAQTLRRNLPADRQWLRHGGFHDVTLLQTPYTERGLIFSTMFWGTPITRNARIGSHPVDQFSSPDARAADDGTLHVRGKALRGNVLSEYFGSTLTFRNALPLRRVGGFDLLRFDRAAQLSMLVAGRYYDGWLASAGGITLWPKDGRVLNGTLRLTLSMPPGTQVTPLRLRGDGVDRILKVPVGATRTFSIPVASCNGPWTVAFSSSQSGYVGDRRVAAQAPAPPVFVPAKGAPAACASSGA